MEDLGGRDEGWIKDSEDDVEVVGCDSRWIGIYGNEVQLFEYRAC